jgi:tRNA G18 (ribose-2'-O)-methylase SpoU
MRHAVPTIVAIEDPSDPRVSAYTSVRERDLVGRQDRFVAEGEVVLRALLSRSHFPIESIFVSEKRLRSLDDAIRSVPAGIPVFVAPQEVMGRIVGFPIHRGVLAIGRRDGQPSPEALLHGCGTRSIVLGLIGIANHDNIGGIFRNAAAFGVDAILLDETSCDPLYRKAIRVSVGAALSVPFAFAGAAENLLRQLETAGFDLISLSPGGAVELGSVERTARTALLLGTEGTGLPASVLARTRNVRIPMARGFDSLNVATASGIALYHLTSC